MKFRLFLSENMVLYKNFKKLETRKMNNNTRFPVTPRQLFSSPCLRRKSGKSARASPTPHHTLHKARTARFIAQPSPALMLTCMHERFK